MLPKTSKNKWKTFTLSVPEGTSTLQWYLFSDDLFGLSKGISTFKIRSIEISGRRSDIQCPECEPGYFSDEVGASQCKPCSANFVSTRGATKCQHCLDSQYARMLFNGILNEPVYLGWWKFWNQNYWLFKRMIYCYFRSWKTVRLLWIFASKHFSILCMEITARLKF